MLILRATRKIRSRIAVVELFGSIGGQIKSPQYEQIFADIARDDNIGALVLDIDSPGGGVSASDYLYRSVLKVADKKPVVASIRGLGASGAYYISCAAHQIVASHAAIIGSIGVISVRPALQELMQRAGIGVHVNKSAQHKDIGAFWRDATPEEEEKMQALIDDSFATFVGIVAQARKMPEQQVREIATGEIYWATKAKQIGLIDELGDLDKALDIAAQLSGAPRKPVYFRPRRSLRQLLMNPAAEAFTDAIGSELDRRIWQNRLP